MQFVAGFHQSENSKLLQSKMIDSQSLGVDLELNSGKLYVQVNPIGSDLSQKNIRLSSYGPGKILISDISNQHELCRNFLQNVVLAEARAKSG